MLVSEALSLSHHTQSPTHNIVTQILWDHWHIAIGPSSVFWLDNIILIAMLKSMRAPVDCKLYSIALDD